MAYPHVYNSPDNFDVNERPSNRQLKTYAMIQCVLTVLFGVVVLPILYVVIGGDPKGVVSTLFAVIGAVGFLFVFRRFHLKRGRNKKAEFISAGGNAAGITTWMFGSMPGKLLDDGRWQWTNPPSDGYGDGGNSSSDGGGGD
jgi:hypothetical protein